MHSLLILIRMTFKNKKKLKQAVETHRIIEWCHLKFKSDKEGYRCYAWVRGASGGYRYPNK